MTTFEAILQLFWSYFEAILKLFWNYFETILKLFWSSFNDADNDNNEQKIRASCPAKGGWQARTTKLNKVEENSHTKIPSETEKSF